MKKTFILKPINIFAKLENLKMITIIVILL